MLKLWIFFSTFFFFKIYISGISEQSPKTDMLRRFSIKSVHSPFLVLDYHFLLPSSICCWHLLWHNTSGSKSLALGLWAGTVQGHFCLLAEEHKLGSAIRSLVTQFPGHLSPKAYRRYTHWLVSALLKASSLISAVLYQFRFWGFNINPLD